MGLLDKYGKLGVQALQDATPRDTGLASSSWNYTIDRSSDGVRLSWSNSDIENGYNVAILIQYGHGTKSGTYVEGRDFINPAMQSIFDNIAKDLWKEV